MSSMDLPEAEKGDRVRGRATFSFVTWSMAAKQFYIYLIHSVLMTLLGVLVLA